MQRDAIAHLSAWKDRRNRKPIVIRGARQVGKSFLVNLFAAENGLELLEINFELEPNMRHCFDTLDPAEITRTIEVVRARPIVPGCTLLFLDEIQAAPQALKSLRYFYEKLPALHVAAAGSLLDFTLADSEFSMPVGRIEYLHLGPMNFNEYLRGLGRDSLAQEIEIFDPRGNFPAAIHNEAMRLYREFLVVGGMPGVVRTYAVTGSFLEAEREQQSILSTYRDDFGKYGSRIDRNLLDRIFSRLPAQVGKKLKYANLSADNAAADVKKALHPLKMAGIFKPVTHSSGNGLPLGAEDNPKFIKPLFLDVGLLSRALGTKFSEINSFDMATLINSGCLTEQFVGQHLLYSRMPWEEPELFYWSREKRQSEAEVDYLIAHGGRVIPVEVKAGKTGTLKSLSVFLAEKRLDLAVRLNADLPSVHDAALAIPGNSGSYRLLSLPVYAVDQIGRCLEQM